MTDNDEKQAFQVKKYAFYIITLLHLCRRLRRTAAMNRQRAKHWQKRPPRHTLTL